MAGLVPALHAFAKQEDVDARDKPGHDTGKPLIACRAACKQARARRHHCGTGVFFADISPPGALGAASVDGCADCRNYLVFTS
jgi:hypothetical protein